MTLWNFNKKVIFSSKGKYVLAILPTGVSIVDVIEEIIVKPCMQLERGNIFCIRFGNFIVKELVYGTLFFKEITWVIN